MDQDINSDQAPAMLASNMFYQMLNYHLQLTPFSAQISLKKSLMKDKPGNLLLPYFMPENESNVKTENEDNSSLTAQNT